MPLPLLNAYAENLSRLTAEESLLEGTRIAVGSGTLKKGVGSRIARGWERQADQQRVVLRPQGPAEYRAQMAAVGIGVKREKLPTVEDSTNG